MADNKVIIAVVVVAVVAIAAVGAFVLINNGNGNNNDETFYFYINYGDNDTKTGWYTATGTNTDDVLAAAVKDKGITITYSKRGYPNFDEGSWGAYAYTWNNSDTVTADASLDGAVYGTYGEFVKSNGWISYAGYGNDAKKMYQSECNIFYFAKYDPVTYAIDDPAASTLWKNAEGSPFVKGVNPVGDYKYYFYIYFGDNDAKTGWYSATSKNADDALAAAIKDKGITVSYGTSGYPSFDDRYWGTFAYTWYYCNTQTADASVDGINVGPYDEFVKSNGWVSYAGYGDAEKKLNQGISYVFFFAPYDSITYEIEDPTTTTLWKNAEGSPFKA